MAANFQLHPKGQSEPANLNEVDNAMRAHFGQAPDEDNYMASWFNRVGLLMALGFRGPELRNEIRQNWRGFDEAKFELIAIADWIESNYEVSNWS